MAKSYEQIPMFSYRELITALRVYQEVMENLASAEDHDHTGWENKTLSMGEAFSLLNIIEREAEAIFGIKVKEAQEGKPIEDIDRRLFDRRKNKRFAINDYIRPLLLIMRDEDRLKYFNLAKEYNHCDFMNKLFNHEDHAATKVGKHHNGI